jgi:putative iron-dependent peroxidase
MLERMFVGVPPGAYDRILDFSTAITGTTFFVPTAGMLQELAEPPAEPTATAVDVKPEAPSSLGIGSLRGQI